MVNFMSGQVLVIYLRGFPCGSDGKESASNARDLSLIPGSGISPGKGNGYSPVFLVNLCTEKLISIV